MSRTRQSADPGAGTAPARRIVTEVIPRRVRAFLGGIAVADTLRPLMLFEEGHVPAWYFPLDDVRMDRLVPSEHVTHCPWKGDARYWTVRVGDRVAENAAWSYPSPRPDAPDLSAYLSLYWNAMDAWFEEDEEVYVHPRDPYKRVDVLASSRRVEVILAGEKVADCARPRLLFETGLPVRYYLPKVDVRLDWLVPSPTRTRCPYKGVASYYSAAIGSVLVEDIAWYYPFPVPECPKIENLVCFYNERVDELRVDGVVEERPQTKWA